MFRGFFIFMLELLLNEEDFCAALDELESFANANNIEMDRSSKCIVEIATTLMLSVELEDNTFVMLAKLIYNVGYRDNHFKSPIIH